MPRYVRQDSPTPVPPYLSWETAAHTIQEAVDVAVAGDTVIVTNGVYAVGSRSASEGAPLNRVLIDRAITVLSVEGPQFTRIEGSRGEAVRCVYLGSNATLIGFTLAKGFAGDGGGGVWSESSAVVSNCWITGNEAELYGGGVTGGTVLGSTVTNNVSEMGGGLANCAATNCVVNNNRATHGGGGAYASLLVDCHLVRNSAMQGGGAVECTLTRCLLTGNRSNEGGGAAASTLNECILENNRAEQTGGGADGSTLNRCVVEGNGSAAGGGADQSLLNDCTVVRNEATFFGGGASRSTLNNCEITHNSSPLWGGGVSDCPVNNSSLTRNTARYGGGADGGTLNNCTVTENWALTYGGGTYSSTVRNSILYHNTVVSFGSNYFGGTIDYSCTTPLPPQGVGNISAEPQLASASHLSASSPCRGAGNPDYASGVDMDGEAWSSPPSIGCDEFVAGSLTDVLTVSIRAEYFEAAVGFPMGFIADIEGRVGASRWEFGDGTVLSNRPYATHAWMAAGDYEVVLRVFNDNSVEGVATTVTVRVVEVPVRYVVSENPSAAAPFDSWATAARTIQEAVDASLVAGSLILVSNGVYAPLKVPRALTLRSVNGPASTVVDGGGDSRCVALANGAVLSGFTLTNGLARGPIFPGDQEGGGVWCESASTVVSNCVILGSSAGAGGGVNGGTLNNCVLAGNSAEVGGGADSVILNNCLIVGNSAEYGGGVHWGVLNSCTAAGNSASGGDGGVSICSANNCIVYGNTAPDGPNYSPFPLPPTHICTTPMPEAGVGNIDLDPQFVDAGAGNYQLGSSSPCIDAGLNNGLLTWVVDLAGATRIVNGTVDMGAYEYGHSPRIAPWIVRQPSGGTFVFGETVRLTIGVRGTLPLSYQWFHGASALPGENGLSLTFQLISPQQIGDYHVLVSNSAGSIQSLDAVVQLPNQPPGFTKGPDIGANSRPTPAAFSFPGWATGITSGPATEPAQGLTFLIETDNAGLFESGPSIDASGRLAFALAAFASGLAQVTVTLQDDGGTARGGADTSAPQTFAIRVTHTNTPPVARDDSVATTEGAPVTFNLLANDSDLEGDNLSILFAFLPQSIHGHLTLSAVGEATYRPNAGFVGTVRFEYTISDGHPGGTNFAVVTVTVSPAPTACRAALWPSERSLSFPGQTTLLVIALDGQEGCAVLSGGNIDPPGSPLQASWVWDGTNYASGMLLTNCFQIGCHEVTLTVSDGQTSCRSTVELCLITPAEAIERCMELLEHITIDRKTKRPLTASLESAARSVERGDFVASLNQLGAFQNKVRAQVARRWPDEAQVLLDATQRLRVAIADALP